MAEPTITNGRGRAQTIAQIKTPLGVCALGLFTLETALVIIASTADITQTWRAWLILVALIILVSMVLGSAFLYYQQTKPQPERQHLGSKAPKKAGQLMQKDSAKYIVSPDGRTEAYEKLRSRAGHRIAILGIAMIDLSTRVLHSIEENATRVNVDLAMIDPEYLKVNPNVADELSSAFNIAHITEKAESSYNRLKTLCENWNMNPQNVHRIRLRVYRHLPSFGMVMIDAGEPTSEMLAEIYLFKMNIRPRFELTPDKGNNSLFEVLNLEYNELWKHARCVVPPSQTN